MTVLVMIIVLVVPAHLVLKSGRDENKDSYIITLPRMHFDMLWQFRATVVTLWLRDEWKCKKRRWVRSLIAHHNICKELLLQLKSYDHGLVTNNDYALVLVMSAGLVWTSRLMVQNITKPATEVSRHTRLPLQVHFITKVQLTAEHITNWRITAGWFDPVWHQNCMDCIEAQLYGLYCIKMYTWTALKHSGGTFGCYWWSPLFWHQSIASNCMNCTGNTFGCYWWSPLCIAPCLRPAHLRVGKTGELGRREEEEEEEGEENIKSVLNAYDNIWKKYIFQYLGWSSLCNAVIKNT